MGVYIKGFDVPISCERCPMLDWDLDYIKCKVTGRHFKMTECWRSIRVPDCPLIPVPPHDRLIEYHAACHAVYDGYKEFGLTWRNAEVMLGKLPTIIPAEEGE